MKLVSMIAAGVLAFGAGGCASAPAVVDHRPALMAPCANATDDTPWLTIAIWDDGDSYRQMTRFEADGKMPYGYEEDEGANFDNGRWSINGDNLVFDMNDHYADYSGTFDGVAAKGTMKNVADNFGTWTMERACTG